MKKVLIVLCFILSFPQIGDSLLTPRTRCPNTLSPTGFTVNQYQYTVDCRGNVLAVWSIFNGSNVVLQAACKPFNQDCWILPGDPRQQDQIISPLRFTANNFQLAGDIEGNAVVIWQVFNGFNSVLQASYKPAGCGWIVPGSPRFQDNVISYFDFNVSVPPALAIANGNVVIAWQIFNGDNTVVQVSTRTLPIDCSLLPPPCRAPSQGFRGNLAFDIAPGGFTQPGTPRNRNNILSPFLFNVISNPVVAIDPLFTFPVAQAIPANTSFCPCQSQINQSVFTAIVAWRIFNRADNVIQAVIIKNGTPTPPIPFPPPIIGRADDPREQANIVSPLRFNVISNPQVSISNNKAVVIYTLFDGISTVLQAATSTTNDIQPRCGCNGARFRPCDQPPAPPCPAVPEVPPTTPTLPPCP